MASIILGFTNGTLETIVLTIRGKDKKAPHDKVKKAIKCKRFIEVKNSENAKKNIEIWFDKHPTSEETS